MDISIHTLRFDVMLPGLLIVFATPLVIIPTIKNNIITGGPLLIIIKYLSHVNHQVDHAETSNY